MVLLMVMRVIVTGASGLIGAKLCEKLREAGHEPVRLVRREAKGADEISWDPAAGTIDSEALEGCDAVVHLAGAGIGDKRWSKARKRELADSRIRSTHLLATALAGLHEPPKAFLSGSAIGIYGETGDRVADEAVTEGASGPDATGMEPAIGWVGISTQTPEQAQNDVSFGNTAPALSGTPSEIQFYSEGGFLSELCKHWEAAAAPAAEAGIRTVLLRTGIVVDSKAPFLKRQLPLFKLGLGGRLGSKSRWISWISLEDEVAAIIWLLEHEDISGPVNLVAPNPVTNQEFTKTLGRILRRPTLLPVPTLLPSLLLGSELINALTESTRVAPKALTDHNYPFAHPRLEPALRDTLDRPA